MATRIIVVLTLLVTVLVSTSTAQALLDANGCVVDGGVYNEASKRCECKPGYDGIGDMCCTPVDDYDVCLVKGDPTLRSVNNQRVSLNIPCAVCINVMQGTTQDDKACMWEILSSATIQDKGAMYSSVVNVAVSVNRKSPTYFTFDGDNIFNPVSNEVFSLDPNGKASAIIEGETIQLSLSPSGLWTMEGCQNRLVFRPKKGGNNGIPGMCMQSTKGSTQMTLQQGNLCNLKSSFDDIVPWKLGVLNSALNTRLVFTSEQKASHPDYDQTCNEVDDLMGTYCQGISNDAMAKCGSILYSSDIRYCLDAAGVKGKEMAGLFKQCLEAYCEGSQDYCLSLASNPGVQKCLPSLKKCNLWPYFY